MARGMHEPAVLALAALLWLGIASASTTPQGEANSVEQYTSRGHLLRFDDRGYHVSNGRYLLHVTFERARAIAPSSDRGAGDAAALGHVTYSGLWDGISVTYDTPPSGIARSTWTLQPGADPGAIRLRYNRPVTLTQSGELAISFGTGALSESRPVAWQDVGGVRRPIPVAFIQLEDDRVGFRVGGYRRDLPLTIDPTLTWNTFLGGSSSDSGADMAVDSSGNLYVVGSSTGTWGSPVRAYTPPGPATGCPPDPPGQCAWDAFAAKLSSAGDLLWNTFLGGNGLDQGYAIAVDALGEVYVTGQSMATWGSPRRAFTPVYLASDAFVAKLGSDGALTWSTFLGGSSVDVGTGIAASRTSPTSICVAGHSQGTWSGQIFSPRRAYTASLDAFVARLSADGTIAWNTFLGGPEWDQGNAVAFDSSGNCYVAGYSWGSWGSPVSPHTAGADGFAAKLSSAAVLQWHTFLGGSGLDGGSAIAADGVGNVYVSGSSDATWGSPLRPFTPFSSETDVYAAKLTSAGALDWNTFFGGSGDDVPLGMAVDGSSGVYITGYSTATWGNPERPYTPSSTDAFAAKLSPAGATEWNTFLGGDGQDIGEGIGVDGGGTVYVGGRSGATWGSPVTPFTSAFEAFAAQLADIPATTTTTTSSTSTSVEASTTTSSTETTSTSTSTSTSEPTSTSTSTSTSTTDTSSTSTTTSTEAPTTSTSATTSTTSSSTTSTTVASPCPADPDPGCQPAAAGRASLSLARGNSARLKWKWFSSAVVDPTAFGDPTVSTDYVLCLYDASSRRLTARAPAAGDCGGRPCWGFGARSFKYVDRDLTPDGLKKMSLMPGDPGRARITVQGSGDTLLVPPLPLALPVRVQLRQSTSSICWEASYSTSKENGLTRFRARSD